MDAVVKKEPDEYGGVPPVVKQDRGGPTVVQYIELSSSDSDYGDSDDSDDELGFDRSGKKAWVSNGGSGGSNKKQKLDMILPLGFLDPLPREQTPLPLPLPLPLPSPSPVSLALPSPSPVSQALPSPVVQSQSSAMGNGSKQFWKAGDYGDSPSVDCSTSNSTVGMDHVRVHPKFLHSNATSHKWALGAFAELLDNSLDEVCYGATFVNIDMMYNKKDGSKMLLIEDNGGGMDPDKMRQCISLGYSAKSKLANVIGQYGNGFKTSTMRLGADVIVFSRCRGKDSKSPTQSIGMLSYTFLKSTGKEDIVVPMLDYEKEGQGWKKLVRSSSGDWNRNVETIVQWSPYSSETKLFHQFNQMSDHGTRIIIYNLWEDDQGELELDFCANHNDIQIRGVNRDEKIEMARQFPNSRHFLTYRHSLRSYASILYFRLPPGFRIVLRGKDVEHHNIVNDMMLIQEVTYRPTGVDGVPKDANMVATVRMGFVKDAKDHIDVQGFNVYHKNRLIKPFWRVWNAAGSDGRGVIGVLEANFVEPAHDKQGFERTTVLQRLESRLIQMQKTYWSSNCHKIGYAPRRHKKLVNESGSRESSPDYTPHKASARSNKSTTSNIKEPKHDNGKHSAKVGNKSSTPEKTSSFVDEDSECEIQITHSRRVSNNNASSAPKSLPRNYPHYNQPSSRNSDYTEARDHISNGKSDRVFTRAQLKAVDSSRNGDAHPLIVSASAVTSLEVDDQALRDRLKKMEESFERDLEIEREKTRSLEAMLKDRGSSSSEAFSPSQLKMENDDLRKKEELIRHELQLETDRCKSLQAQLKAAEEKIEELNKEQEALINIFAEERDRRDDEESKLRRKLKDASMTIQQLLDKVMLLEKMKKSNNFNPEKP